MAAGRYFRALSSYDLLGNLLPGVFVFTFIVTLLPSSPWPTGTGGVLLAAVLSYALGHFVQLHASLAAGDCFEATLDAVREYPLRGEASGHDRRGENVEPNVQLSKIDRLAVRVRRLDRRSLSKLGGKGTDRIRSVLRRINVWFVFPPLLAPAYCWRRNPPGAVLDDEQIAFEVFKDLVTRYEIDRGTTDYQRLTNVISSEIDDISAPARSIRFQAIRNFHRATWIACWYGFVSVAILVAMEEYPVLHALPHGVGISYRTPALFGYWGPDWHFVPVFGGLTVGFERLAHKFEVQFTEYLFSDYRVSRESEREGRGWRTREEQGRRTRE